MKSKFLLGIFVCIGFLSAACTDTETTSDKTEKIAQASELKIISLNPSATEILYELGVGDQVIAVDAYSDYPVNAPSDERLDAFTPDVELLLDLEPTLVIFGVDDTDAMKVLVSQDGITTIVQPTAVSLENMYANITDIGIAVDKESEADSLNKKLRDHVAAAAEALDGIDAAVYHEAFPGDNNAGFYTNHAQTFVGDVYTQLGLQNIASLEDLNENLLDQELVINRNPDLIVLNGGTDAEALELVSKRSGWESINAVKNKNVIAVSTSTSSRSGPRIVEFIDSIVSAVNESASPS